MFDILRNGWLGIKSAFQIGKTIGQEGKQKEFVKNPIKTINEVTSNGSEQNPNSKDQ